MRLNPVAVPWVLVIDGMLSTLIIKGAVLSVRKVKLNIVFLIESSFRIFSPVANLCATSKIFEWKIQLTSNDIIAGNGICTVHFVQTV